MQAEGGQLGRTAPGAGHRRMVGCSGQLGGWRGERARGGGGPGMAARGLTPSFLTKPDRRRGLLACSLGYETLLSGTSSRAPLGASVLLRPLPPLCCHKSLPGQSWQDGLPVPISFPDPGPSKHRCLALAPAALPPSLPGFLFLDDPRACLAPQHAGESGVFSRRHSWSLHVPGSAPSVMKP